MKLDDMVQRANRHVAILGAFNMDPGTEVIRGKASEVLEQLKAELSSKRRLRRRNGNVEFYSYDVVSPAELKGRIAEGDSVNLKEYQSLPDNDGVLSRYLADPTRGTPGTIGAALLVTLLDAADAVRAFDHPAFAVQLTEGLYYAWDSCGLPREIVDAAMLRKILYHPAFNHAFLNYLRAGNRQHAGGSLRGALVKGVSEALVSVDAGVKEDAAGKLAESFAAETAAYRDWLIAPARPGEVKSVKPGNKVDFSVLEESNGHGAEFKALRSRHAVPEHENGTMRQAYGIFRAAHDQLADLAQCEPLMAYVNQWYLESFSRQQSGHALAQAIFTSIYKDNKEARPSKIPHRVKRDAAGQHAKELKTLLENPSTKPQDVMAREIAETTLDARQKIRRPMAAFERRELIALMCDELKSLSLKLFPGRDVVVEKNLKLIEAFYKAERGVERCFDVEAGENAVKELRDTLAPVFATLGEEVAVEAGKEQGKKAEAIFESVLAKVGAEPAKIAVALVLALGPAEGTVQAAIIENFRKEEGTKSDQAGIAVRDGYEKVLSTPDGLNVAGSIAAVDNPEQSARRAREEKVRFEIARQLARESDTIEVIPADEAEADEMTSTEAAPTAATAGVGDPSVPRGSRGDSADLLAKEDAEKLPQLSAGSGESGGHDTEAGESRRALMPVAVPLTAEERRGLLQKATKATLKEGSRGIAPAVRRWAEAVVDARERVVAEKGKIVADPRITALDDPVGKALAAGSRYVTIGEFFLTAPSANSPIGKPDTSFNAMITLYLMRQTGRENGLRTRDVLSDWKQKNPEDIAAKPDPATDAIRKVPLWQICPAIFDSEGLKPEEFEEKFKDTATDKITGFIAEVRAQTAALSRLSGFYRDVEEVKSLLRLLKDAGDCDVTMVNIIAADYAKTDKGTAYPAGGPLFNGRKGAVDDTPPGTVFVSGQAFPPDTLVRDLDVLTAPLGLTDSASGEAPLKRTPDTGGNPSSWLRVNAHPGVLGVPVLIGRHVRSSVLPVVGNDLPGLPELVALLTGGQVEGLKPFSVAWGEHTRGGGLSFEISSANSVLKALGMMLQSPTVHGPIITSRVLTGLAHQRQFGPFQNKAHRMLAGTGDFDPTTAPLLLVQAIDAALAALAHLNGHLGEKDLASLVFMKSNNGWKTRKDWPDEVGDPSEWIAFAPSPGAGASAAPNVIFTRL